MYKSGSSMHAIEAALRTNDQTIRNVLCKFGIEVRRPGVHYKLDETYFDVLTPDVAYWLGFIAADGCVYSNWLGGKEIRITLHRTDRHILETLAADIQSNRPLSESRTRPHTSFTVTSTRIFDALARWGIHERKSLTLQPPVDLPEPFVRDWIRGYFDGDGCISVTTRDRAGRPNERRYWDVVGTEAVVRWIADRLIERGLVTHISVRPHNGIWRAVTTRRDDIIRIRDWFYESAGDHCLVRKRKKMFSIAHSRKECDAS